jgi:hypothetical protein
MWMGAHELNLRVCDGDLQADMKAVTTQVSVKCHWCDVRLTDREAMCDHILAEHDDRVFERLALHGEAKIGGPKALIVCLECGKFYPDSALPSENPITLMGAHVNRCHERMRYRHITDPEEVRSLLGLEEMWVWRCKLEGCPATAIVPVAADQSARSNKKSHLLEEHSEIFMAGR